MVNNPFPPFFRGLLDLACPPLCLACNECVEEGRPFCDACREKLVTPEGRFCPRCGGRRFHRREDVDACSRCRNTRFRFRRVLVLGEYETELRRLVLQMKTQRSGLLATALAGLLAEERAEQLREADIDLILPVPMHRFRRWQRGVNPPDLLADELARRLRRPVAGNLLIRARRTDLQYTLSAAARTRNVENAFRLSPPRMFEFLRRSVASRIEGRSLLLVDDIFTTGATCNEIARLLRTAGAREILVAAVARAEGIYDQYRNR